MNAVPIHHGWPQQDFTTYSYLIPQKGYKIVNVERNKNGWLKSFLVKDAQGRMVDPFMIKDVIMPVDFFWYSDGIPAGDSTAMKGFSSWEQIMKGKLMMSKLGPDEVLFQRKKDQKDFVLMKPITFNKLVDTGLYYVIASNTAASPTVITMTIATNNDEAGMWTIQKYLPLGLTAAS